MAGQTCAFTPEGLLAIEKSPELGYLTGIVFRLFESMDFPGTFRAEVMFSPGCSSNNVSVDQTCTLQPYVMLNKSLNGETMIDCLDNAIKAGLTEDQMSEYERTVEIETLSLEHKPPTNNCRQSFSAEKKKVTQEISVSTDVEAEDGNENPNSVSSSPDRSIVGKLRQFPPLRRTRSITVVGSGSESSDQWEHLPNNAAVGGGAASEAVAGSLRIRRHTSKSFDHESANSVKDTILDEGQGDSEERLSTSLPSPSSFEKLEYLENK
jgi:hypothetical protein